MSQDRFSLAGRRALVTGASSGIGRAVAIALAQQGATVALHHFGDAAGVRDTAAAIGPGTAVLEADFTDSRAMSAFACEVADGAIDILVSNGAIERRRAWDEVDEAHIQAHVAANFTALFTLATRLVPAMAKRGWGRVVATGSVMARRPRAETIVYASLKAAQLTAVRAMARDVAPHGVTMNVVSPGAIETEATAERYRDAAFRQAVAAKIPAGRHGQPDDVVGAFVFLCSDAARYITGADIPVDGGWTIGDAPGALPGATA
ncbi:MULTISPECIES: SDR family oxidoreductase [unclassified Mesorhizobium]|uniref:SDR family NAD(P)-dependent oxidoreductase n=1 Tax=unclassified Mesorhizobium TaxID=325217 RepID=UPI000FD8ABF1|nr:MULTISPECIES: SDR family oxidoreductase [unclassified Mesorhizobium]TGR43544.1 SDR family oxidoreductase [bacterium M00.F.Ca.ET.199.01.1.1]TGU39890.1 SDR family oxidoreductase [bacterium M00.F.Ca.ET.156.01.1.1]TGV86697.1 SDR family oxidoreductase [Mesorhizobium sp. M00.F.Ca.ET.149.01.1.1]TGQ87797.1 SDR family oxidoreductase [Mesorhizobium sp. M8A.F.Ca.ET.208.01.1.1]TGR27875.1 SDR family oxidoreductase [Mesorhizobium sp. M8A.F.Ca.ET.197.01.1.1]